MGGVCFASEQAELCILSSGATTDYLHLQQHETECKAKTEQVSLWQECMLY